MRALAPLTAALLTLPHLMTVKADPDLWGHTVFGIAHIQSGRLADADPYSYTFPGAEWTNHEWLCEWLFGAAYLAGGETGMMVLRGSLLLFITLGVTRLLTERLSNLALVGLLNVLIIPFFAIYINVRPHSFTYALMVALLLALDAVRRGGFGWLAAIPVIVAAWVNLHGGFIVGVALAGAGLGALLFNLEDAPAPPPPRQRIAIIVTGLTTLAAVLVNPYGFEILTYLSMALSLERPGVAEWQALGGAALVPYAVFFALALLLALGARAWRRGTQLLFFFIGAWAGLSHGRFFVILILFSALLTASSLEVLWGRLLATGRLPTLSRLESPRAAVVIAVLAAALSVPVAATAALTHGGPSILVSPAQYPVAATAWLKGRSEVLGSRLALPFGWGEYAIWHLYPDYRVSMDGRYETVYDPPFIEALQTAEQTGDLTTFTTEQGADVLLVLTDSPLQAAAQAHPDWTLHYIDDTAAIFAHAPATAPLDARTGQPRPWAHFP
jgi:hypothetical protein